MTIHINQSFWQANAWGILGTISGVSGVLISWFGFKYNKPKIEIEKSTLVIPDWVAKSWAGKTKADLMSHFLDFELEIQVRNKKGGSGSIDKPTLVIKLLKSQDYKIEPITQHTESEKDLTYQGTGDLWKTWTVRHGRSFNLGPGGKADEDLTYRTRDLELIEAYSNNFQQASYYLEYTDNNGKLHQEKVKKILKETETMGY